MLIQLGVSVLIGWLVCCAFIKFINKSLVIKGRHIHHTSEGILSGLVSIPLILRDIGFGIYLAGLGVGIISHHWFSEKNLKLISRVNYKKSGLIKVDD